MGNRPGMFHLFCRSRGFIRVPLVRLGWEIRVLTKVKKQRMFFSRCDSAVGSAPNFSNRFSRNLSLFREKIIDNENERVNGVCRIDWHNPLALLITIS